MDISAELTDVLRSAIRRMVEGKDVAVAFSGGLDSGIVAAITKEYASSVRLYTAGVMDAYDVLESKALAETLGMEWEHILISEKDLEDSIREPAAVIMCSFATLLDTATAMFGSYVVSVKTKMVEHHTIHHFI